MNESDIPIQIDPMNRERLVMMISPRRISLLFYYVFGACLFIIGLTFNLSASAEIIHPSFGSWFIGLASLISGVIFIIQADYKVKTTLYILTTWNVRIRTGFFNKKTERIFYDDIDRIETLHEPGEKVAQMGDVRIFKKGDSNTPYLILRDVRHPEGLVEIIKRFITSITEPTEWAHIEK